MLNLTFPELLRPLRVLCLGAHSDDLEIGCAGTVLRLQSERNITVRWVVFGCSGARSAEARESALALLGAPANPQIDVHEFRDGYFPYVAADIKDAFESLKAETPDLILTHTSQDRHQDHRLINELTWNTFRGQLILEYEIPKYDGDLGTPNLFVPLNESIVQKKVEHLMNAFPTQRTRHWFDEETFRGLMRLRGVECGSRFAEAFYVRKIVL